MLSDHDKLIIEEIVESIVDKRVDQVENKIDKILKIPLPLTPSFSPEPPLVL